MTIILKLNTIIRDSSPNQIGTPLSRRSSQTISKPSANNRNGQSTTMCIVCSSAPGESMRCAHLPCSVRKRFNNTQLCRRKSKAGGWTFWFTIRSLLTGSDADHAAKWRKMTQNAAKSWHLTPKTGSFDLNLNLNFRFASSLKPCYVVDCWYLMEDQCA
jgi:hypothetical protein